MKSISADFNISWIADHEQHWRGHGVTFTHYDDCATGCGETLLDAFNDALEQFAQGDIEISSEQETLMLADLICQVRGHGNSKLKIPVNDKRAGYCTARKTAKHREDCAVCNGDWHFYVSIDVMFSRQDEEEESE